MNPGTWFVYGICRFVGEEYKEAARGFRRCVQLEYDNFEAWANLRYCFFFKEYGTLVKVYLSHF